MVAPSSAIKRDRHGQRGGLPLVDPRIANARTAARQQFVTALVDILTADDRFVAAWLTGSIARGDEDALSDVDLSLVVADEAAVMLCARPWQLAGYTTPARAALFERFGQPAIIHENQHNAPPDGSWTCVIYASLLTVDWGFICRARFSTHSGQDDLTDAPIKRESYVWINWCSRSRASS